MAAFAAFVAQMAVLVVAVLRYPFDLLISIVAVIVAVSAAAVAISRRGAVRWIAATVAIAAALVPPALMLSPGRPAFAASFLALGAIVAGAARYALSRDARTARSTRPAGVEVPAAAQGVLLVNPRSGDGKAERSGLVAEARRRGLEAVILDEDDDLEGVARRAVAAGADAIGMAGGDGSQAIVAAVARDADLPFICVPSGTRNHFALDLGLDRDDVVGALDAFGAAIERRVDLARVGDRVFVNNVSLGIYARIVTSKAYRGSKPRTAAQILPDLVGPESAPFDLRFVGPDGAEHDSALIVQVSNGAYDLSAFEGFGSRPSLEDGVLGIVAAHPDRPQDVVRLVLDRARGPVSPSRGWSEWTAQEFEVRSSGPVEAGVDGEAVTLQPPLRFRTLGPCLRVRIPAGAPGRSPAALALGPANTTLPQLWNVATGRQTAAAER
jgi:diacylglycerol kinase family enzyme